MESPLPPLSPDHDGLHYTVEQQVLDQKELPLLSASDLKLLLAQQLIRNFTEEQVLASLNCG